MSMYICIYVYRHICIYAYVYIYIYICTEIGGVWFGNVSTYCGGSKAMTPSERGAPWVSAHSPNILGVEEAPKMLGQTPANWLLLLCCCVVVVVGCCCCCCCCCLLLVVGCWLVVVVVLLFCVVVVVLLFCVVLLLCFIDTCPIDSAVTEKSTVL